MNEFVIQKINHLDTHKLLPLVEESTIEGFRHLKRLVNDYESGVNKFDKDGEALFIALQNNEIVGVCGLNSDPYVTSKEVGRVRRLYVLPRVRRFGLGRSSLTDNQQTILFTMYTRHHNGYTRENNVKKVIAKATDCSWITPYLMFLIGEYVEEILQVIYANRSLLNADFIKTFIFENPKCYRTVQSRVVSYWNCYYRWKYPKREQYVGFKILDYLNRLLN